MYIRRGLAAALVAIILCGIPLYADYSDAQYEGTLNIVNAGAAVSRVTAKLTTNTQSFIDAGFLDSSFNNVWFTDAGGNALAFMPKPGTISEWYFFYPYTLPATATSLGHIYMGGPDMSAPLYYLPGAAGMTRIDTASMELGNNFAIEQKGYIDTSYGADKRLVYKSAAFQTLVSAEGVVSSIIGATTTVRPTGFNDPDSQWFDENKTYDNNTTTFGYTLANGYLELTRAPTMTNAIRIYAKTNVGGVDPNIWVDYYDGSSWHFVYSGEIADLEWVTLPLPNGYDTVTQVRVKRNAVTQLHINEVDWTAVDCVVSAAVPSGAHTIRTEADGTDLELYVDGVLTDAMALGAATVPDNANSWSFVTNGCMPYVEYHKLWVGGALKQHIEWENAATFTDLSSNSNDATPSFPAASSDPDVSVTLASLESAAPAEAPGTAGAETGGMAGAAPTEPDNMYDELDASMEGIPGVAVVNALLDAGEIPRVLFWFMFVFVAIIVLCLVTYHFARSLMATALVAGAGMVFASKIGIIPYWVTVPLVIIAIGVLVKEKMSPL